MVFGYSPAMRIGELAHRTGLSRDTLRFYEKHELIASNASEEASNDYRDYPDHLVERLEMIIAARAAGMSIADLKMLILHMETEPSADFDVEQFMTAKILELRASIASARKFLRLLEARKSALAAGPVEWRKGR